MGSRKRESVQERNNQAGTGSPSLRELTNDGNQYHTNVVDTPDDAPSRSGALLSQHGQPLAPVSRTNPYAVEDALFLPFPQGTKHDPLESAGFGPNFSVSDLTPGVSATSTALLSYNAQIEPTPASPFADYAITLPGLSVICAKVNLFNHIVGPGYLLDIWDPRALSPISLGAPTRPCPVNFQPTQLQRSVPHHPIIDVFPWPLFRDRFLYTMSLPRELRPSVAQDEMPQVTLEVMLAAKDPIGGIRVWGSNAFLAENWEIGQTFHSKFWWAIDASIIRNSNQHRARRGEGNLRFDFSYDS